MRRFPAPLVVSVCKHLQTTSLSAHVRSQGVQSMELLSSSSAAANASLYEEDLKANEKEEYDLQSNEHPRVLCSQGYGPSTDLLTGVTPQNTLHVHTTQLHPADVAIQRQILALAAPELNVITVENTPELNTQLHPYKTLPLHQAQSSLRELVAGNAPGAPIAQTVRDEMTVQWDVINRKWEDQLREVSQMIIDQIMNDHALQLNTFSALQGEQRRAVTEMVMQCIRDEMDELRRTVTAEAQTTQRLLEQSAHEREEQQQQHQQQNEQISYRGGDNNKGAFPVEELISRVTEHVSEQLQSGFVSSQQNTTFAIEQLHQKVGEYFQQLQQNINEALVKMETVQSSANALTTTHVTKELEEKGAQSSELQELELTDKKAQKHTLLQENLTQVQNTLVTQMSEEVRHVLSESMLTQQEHISNMLHDILTAVQARKNNLQEHAKRTSSKKDGENEEKLADDSADDWNDIVSDISGGGGNNNVKGVTADQFYALANENKVQVQELEEFIEGALQTATDNIRLTMTTELKKLAKQSSKEANKQGSSSSSMMNDDNERDNDVVINLIQDLNTELDRALSMSETSLETVHATKSSVELVQQRQENVERVLAELKALMEQTSMQLQTQHHALQSSLQEQTSHLASSLSQALAHRDDTVPSIKEEEESSATSTQDANKGVAETLSHSSLLVTEQLREQVSHMTKLMEQLRHEVQLVRSETSSKMDVQQAQREQELEHVHQDLLDMSHALSQSITSANPSQTSSELAATVKQISDQLNVLSTQDWYDKVYKAAGVAAADAVNAAMQSHLTNLSASFHTEPMHTNKTLSSEEEHEEVQKSVLNRDELKSTIEHVIRPYMEQLVQEFNVVQAARRDVQAQEMIALANSFTEAVHVALSEFAVKQAHELKSTMQQVETKQEKSKWQSEQEEKLLNAINAMETKITSNIHDKMVSANELQQTSLINALDTNISHKLEALQEKLMESIRTDATTPPEIDLTNLFKYIDGAVTVIRDELTQQKELHRTQSTQLAESITQMVQHNLASHQSEMNTKLAEQITHDLQTVSAEIKANASREEKMRNNLQAEMNSHFDTLPDRVEERMSTSLRKIQQAMSDGAKTHTSALEHIEEKLQSLPSLVEIESTTRKVENAASSAIRELGTQIDTSTSLLNDVVSELRKTSSATTTAIAAANSTSSSTAHDITQMQHHVTNLHDKIDIMEGAASGRYQEIIKAAENNKVAISSIRTQLETLQGMVSELHGPQHVALLESIQELLFRENMKDEEQPQTSQITSHEVQSDNQTELNKSKSASQASEDDDHHHQQHKSESSISDKEVLNSLERIHAQLERHSAQLLSLQTEATKAIHMNDTLQNKLLSSDAGSAAERGEKETSLVTKREETQEQYMKRIMQLLERLDAANSSSSFSSSQTSNVVTQEKRTSSTSPSLSDAAQIASTERSLDLHAVLHELRDEIGHLRSAIEHQSSKINIGIDESEKKENVEAAEGVEEVNEAAKKEAGKQATHDEVAETVIDTDVLSEAIMESIQPQLQEMSHSVQIQLTNLLDKVQSRMENIEKTHNNDHEAVFRSIGEITQEMHSITTLLDFVKERTERIESSSNKQTIATDSNASPTSTSSSDANIVKRVAEEQTSLTCKTMEQTLDTHTRSILDALQDAQQSTDAIVNRYREDLLSALRELPQEVGTSVQTHLNTSERTHKEHLVETLQTHFAQQASTLQGYIKNNVEHMITSQNNGIEKQIAQLSSHYVQEAEKDTNRYSSTLTAMSELNKIATELQSGHRTMLQIQEETRQNVHDTLEAQKVINESVTSWQEQQLKQKQQQQLKQDEEKEKLQSPLTSAIPAALQQETETIITNALQRASVQHRGALTQWLTLLLTPLMVCATMLLCAYYLFACFLLAFVPLPSSQLASKVASTSSPATIPRNTHEQSSPNDDKKASKTLENSVKDENMTINPNYYPHEVADHNANANYAENAAPIIRQPVYHSPRVADSVM